MILHTTTAAIIEKDGKVLLIKRANPPMRGYWAIPGGHVDAGESIWQAVNREMKEEIGNVKIEKKPVMDFIHDVKIGHRHHCYVFVGKPKGKIRAGSDAERLGWFTLGQMRRMNLTHYTIKALNHFYRKRV
jgi:ADP-ribose pyrophosphatase YjhB (NUDIX family)